MRLSSVHMPPARQRQALTRVQCEPHPFPNEISTGRQIWTSAQHRDYALLALHLSCSTSAENCIKEFRTMRIGT